MNFTLTKNNVCTILFLTLFLMLHVSKVPAQTEPPKDFGAKGALQATSITLQEALTYAIQDEYLAQARYEKIIAKFGAIQPFTQIKAAEQRHISALLTLFTTYNIAVPQDNAKQYVTTPSSLKEAFQAGVDGEIDNIAMYNKLSSLSLPSDVTAVMKQLGAASQNHLAAFKSGLQQYQ
ncbi:DUF2202 domain-containing protein [Ectobacillus sp. JY-23]|uniref:ferritin-like domain-containing protein n=1 Tax=Ectobacillus sp. JY-23 TaxID=2933872 RepID=UPI001FF511CD|nr:DUF2202 domain-containing protein [Ectobacillus sp. JY-23]UOY92586.1 DUF2202 domain-containing protein [Ectobacillus sp. JY-23]